MHTAPPLGDLSSLQSVRKMVARHLAGSNDCTSAVLDTIFRHDKQRCGDSLDNSYWNAGGGSILPLRAGVCAEIAALRDHLDLGRLTKPE